MYILKADVQLRTNMLVYTDTEAKARREQEDRQPRRLACFTLPLLFLHLFTHLSKTSPHLLCRSNQGAPCTPTAWYYFGVTETSWHGSGAQLGNRSQKANRKRCIRRCRL